MDHFAGFERILRFHLHRTKVLRIYGPEDFITRVEGKLSGYTWNLTGQYPLSILVTESGEDVLKTAAFRASSGFQREDLESVTWDGTLLDEPGFGVKAVVLDHGTPCLAFKVQQKMHVQILSGELKRHGLVPGSWLSSLKSNVIIGDPPSKKIRIKTLDGIAESTLGELSCIYKIVPGAVLAYVVDAADSTRNVDKIVALAERADLLYIEAAFSIKDISLAVERKHLTAQKAGQIAREACVTRVKIIHLSPRYKGMESELLKEAAVAAGPGIRIEGGWKG